jgi:hypothetical protein
MVDVFLKIKERLRVQKRKGEKRSQVESSFDFLRGPFNNSGKESL